MDKLGLIISLISIITRKINSIICGDKRKGKNEFCTIMLKHLYCQKSLDGIDIKEIIEIINRDYNCDLDKIFRFNTLSSELHRFLYKHDNNFSNDEIRVINSVIAKEKDKINVLFIKKTDSAVQQYINSNSYWFWGLLILTYGNALLYVLSTGQEYSYFNMFLLAVIYVTIAVLVIMVPDCLMWASDKSNILEPGFLVHFLERKYNQYDWVKSFFDYHTKRK